MRLLVDNAEVQEKSIAFPPPDAFEAICRLLKLPFRHDEEARIFAVHPPALGKRVVIGLVAPDEILDGGLLGLVETQLGLLRRLLWVAGADVTQVRCREAAKVVLEGTHPANHWDLAVFVYPNPAISGHTKPLAVYSLWPYPFRNRRLAGFLGETVISLWIAPQLKDWFRDAQRTVCAPSVLLSCPLVHGRSESYLESFALRMANGVLMYLKQPTIPANIATGLAEDTLYNPSTPTAVEDSKPSGLLQSDALLQKQKAMITEVEQARARQSQPREAVTVSAGPALKPTEETRKLRQLLSDTPEAARRFAEVALKEQGIESDDTVVREYLEFLRRALPPEERV